MTLTAKTFAIGFFVFFSRLSFQFVGVLGNMLEIVFSIVITILLFTNHPKIKVNQRCNKLQN